MNVAIIGAGFTGLAAAYELTKHGYTVVLFEAESVPGGLAGGYTKPGWKWSLEQHYHHWFTNDTAAISLANEIGHRVIIMRPKTSIYVGDEIFQLDSPLSVLSFPKLPFVDRIRMGAVLGILRSNPFWKPLENQRAADVLPKLMGTGAWTLLWEPLLTGKFGTAAKDVSLAWFWARIFKRTASLAYPNGGFLSFARTLEKKIVQAGGSFLYNTKVQKISTLRASFDRVLVTVSSLAFTKMAPELPSDYVRSIRRLRSLGAINLVLRLKKPFLPDGTYWLNICDRDFPFLAVVEHTNFINSIHYHKEHLVYVGNYLPADHRYFAMTNAKLLSVYRPYLDKLHPCFTKDIIGFDVFKTPFAQPIATVGYSRMIPPTITPLSNVYVSNMEQVYPWDRGTNYAIKLGQQAARNLISS